VCSVPDDAATQTAAIHWTAADAKILITGSKTSVGVSPELFCPYWPFLSLLGGPIFWHKVTLKPVMVLGEKKTALASELTKASETCDPPRTRTWNQLIKSQLLCQIELVGQARNILPES
jgi:hypothetical protein